MNEGSKFETNLYCFAMQKWKERARVPKDYGMSNSYKYDWYCDGEYPTTYIESGIHLVRNYTKCSKPKKCLLYRRWLRLLMEYKL